MRRFILAAVLAGAACAAFALPTVEDVQAEVGKGNYAHAEEMMRDVVAARPNSARAHYLYAEILAHDRRFELAAEQAARARAIDPALSFTRPESFRAFEQLLEREQAALHRQAAVERPAAAPPYVAPAAVERSSGGIPGWVWVLGLAAVAFVAWRAFSARQQSAGLAASYAPRPPAPYAPGAPMGGGYAPGYGAPPPAAGSGLLGTGLAVAGGVAAGMLAEKLLDGHHDQGYGSTAAPGLGGMAPGLLGGAPDDDAARELEQRPIDFGSGDEWGGGGGGSDGGSSSGSSDDGW